MGDLTLRRLLDLPVERPRLVLLLFTLVTLLLGLGLPRLEIDASIESMIVAGDADHAAFEAHKEVFGSDEVVSVAILLGDALTPESLSLQRRIADRLERLEAVRDIDSLVTSDDIVGEGDSLIVDPLVPDGDPRELSPREQARIRERVATHDLWTGWLVSEDRATAAFQIHLEEPTGGDAEREALIAEIERIVRDEVSGRPFHLAGHPYMKTEIARAMQHDLALFLPVTVAVMAVLLLVAVGSPRMTLVLLGGTGMAVVWMLGAMGWVGEPLTALSNTGPSVLLALATAYFMHLAGAYQKEAARGGPRAERVARALTRVRRPTVVAGLTTAIGFGSLVGSRIPLVSGFGFDLAVGILAVVLIACFALPAALTVLGAGPGVGTLASGVSLGRPLFEICRFTARFARPVLAAAIALAVVCAGLGLGLKIDSSGPSNFAEDSAFRRASEFYRAHLAGDVVANVYLQAPSPEGFKDPERLRRMRAFQAEAERLPEIDQTLSIADYVSLMNRAIFANDPAQERIPDSREAVAQYLLLYSLSGDLEDFDDIVDPSYDRARIVLSATVPSSAASAALRAKLERLAKKHFPEEAGPNAVLSTEILLSQAADSLAAEQIRSFAGALVLIVAVVALGFRSSFDGLLLLLPNALPIAMVLATMALLGMTLSESTAVIAVVALGLAVDSTVHLLDGIRRSQSLHGSRPAAVLHAVQTSGRPVVVSSATIVAGFAVLMLSDFALIAEFGALTALTIVYCLVADLLVLPAQLLAGAGAREACEEVALLAFAGQVVPALRIEQADGKAAFRLLGADVGFRGWPDAPVLARSLAGGRPASGRIVGFEELSDAVLRVEWDEAGPPVGAASGP